MWHALASMFSYLLAMFDYNVFYNSTNPTAAMILFIIFEFVMNVMMLVGLGGTPPGVTHMAGVNHVAVGAAHAVVVGGDHFALLRLPAMHPHRRAAHRVWLKTESEPPRPLQNIMIASMTNSFSKVTQDEGLRFLHSKVGR